MRKTHHRYKIPPHIHQIWVGPHALPKKAIHASRTWKKIHPTYRHTLHRNEGCNNIVSKYYPEYLELYNSLILPVQKADLLRYIIIHHYGGYYADMDTTSVRPLDTVVASSDRCVIGLDQTHSNQAEYLQWFFGAEPRHPLMIEIIRVIQERNRRKPCTPAACLDDKYTLWLTGPLAFTEGVIRYQYMYPENPLTIYDECVFGNYRVYYDQTCRSTAVLFHHYDGSWKKKWNKSERRWMSAIAPKIHEGFVSSKQVKNKEASSLPKFLSFILLLFSVMYTFRGRYSTLKSILGAFRSL
jgi:mannosyltransferase OCH1-like enzyme